MQDTVCDRISAREHRLICRDVRVNGDAGLVLVIQAAAGKAQNVVDALTTYQKDQVAFYGNYAEFAQAQSNVENAVIGSNDSDLVVMVIASNECSADLSSAVDSVLGK